jgi:hypothetical protein
MPLKPDHSRSREPGASVPQELDDELEMAEDDESFDDDEDLDEDTESEDDVVED